MGRVEWESAGKRCGGKGEEVNSEQKEKVVSLNIPSVHEYLSLNFLAKKTVTCLIWSRDGITPNIIGIS